MIIGYMKYSFMILPIICLRRIYQFMAHKFYYAIKTFLFSKLLKIKCGENVKFVGRTIIRLMKPYSINIGKNTVFLSGSENNLVGLTNPTVICAAKGGKIEIGHDSGFSSVIIHARESITLGNYLNVGGNVRIFDHDFHSLDWQDRRPPQNPLTVRSSPVVIEDDVFIGTNAIILKGTRIGARSIIAAGSVVFGLDIPPDSMVKGNPAQIIRRSDNVR